MSTWILGLTLFAAVLSAIVVLLFLTALSLPRRRKFFFKGKHAFVTGGSKGIGKEIARSLIYRGCNVSIAARNAEDLEKTARELREYALVFCGAASKIEWYILDVTHPYDKIDAVIRKAEDALGPVDLLINNAGSSVQDAFDALPLEDFEKQMKLNYLSAVYATRAVIKNMKSRREGHIGFVCSAAGQCPIYGYTAYGASKFAVRGLAEALHMELLPYGVDVSILYPPNTNTEGFQVELETMPKEVADISGSAGLFEPREVAQRYVDNISTGNFSTTVGLEGWMLGVLSAGAAPEKNFLRAIQQVLLAGLLRGIMLIYIGDFNRTVQRRQAEKVASTATS